MSKIQRGNKEPKKPKQVPGESKPAVPSLTAPPTPHGPPMQPKKRW